MSNCQCDHSPATDGKGRVLEVFLTFLKLGLTSFGGPVAHLGYFRKELIEKRAWVSDAQYSQLMAISQFLPGPASSQLGFVMGMLRAGPFGALAAFLAFTLPSAFALVLFASLLPYLASDIAQAGIHGLKLVAFAVVADAVWGMYRKLCGDWQRRAIALAAVVILLLFASAAIQLWVVLGGAVLGLVLCRDAYAGGEQPVMVNYGKRTAAVLLALFVALLFSLPLAVEGLAQVAHLFYQAGALVFGGGHVVLPLLEESVVSSGLMGDEDFLAGYGASQAIPGPMFAFAAYLGALLPGDMGGMQGAVVALAFMFLPGFLLVTAVLPLWQSVAANPVAGRVMAGMNAAVVGILAAALYDPIFTSAMVGVSDLVIGAVALGLLVLWRLSPLWVVLWCVTASVTLEVISGLL